MSDQAIVATRKGLFTLRREPRGWQIASANFLGDTVPIAMNDPRDGSMYAALGHGHFGSKMHASRDGGATWSEIGCPAFPPKPEGVADTLCPMRKIVIPWRVEQIWALSPGGKDQAGTLWCGTIPGGLFRSDDRGASWSLVESLWNHPSRQKWFGGGYDYPGIHSICVDPRDSNRVSLGISCGGVWQTTDGGKSWNCRATGMRAAYLPPEQASDPDQQDPHFLTQCRSAPDTMWVQHHNGIFRTTDNAASWHEFMEVKPSTFGFAVAVHPKNPDIAWFVPALKDEKRVPVDGKVVVTRTCDGGRSFESLSRGLPDRHAYDLVYRHGFSVDETGDRLMFGSTTGSLWVSEDGGDSWNTISTNLPPVFSVQFIER